jgi:hypothetical protein
MPLVSVILQPFNMLEPLQLAMGEGPNSPHRKKKTACYEMLHRVSELADSFNHGVELSCYIKGKDFLTS